MLQGKPPPRPKPRKPPKPPSPVTVAKAQERYYASQGKQIQRVATYQKRRGINLGDFKRPGASKPIQGTPVGAERVTSRVVAPTSGRGLTTRREARRFELRRTPGSSLYNQRVRRQAAASERGYASQGQAVARVAQEQRQTRRYNQTVRKLTSAFAQEDAYRSQGRAIQKAADRATPTLRQSRAAGVKAQQRAYASAGRAAKRESDRTWDLPGLSGQTRQKLMTPKARAKMLSRVSSDSSYGQMLVRQGVLTQAQVQDARWARVNRAKPNVARAVSTALSDAPKEIEKAGKFIASKTPIGDAVRQVAKNSVPAQAVTALGLGAKGFAAASRLSDRVGQGEANYRRLSASRGTSKALSEAVKGAAETAGYPLKVAAGAAPAAAKAAVNTIDRANVVNQGQVKLGGRANRNLTDAIKHMPAEQKAEALAPIIWAGEQVTRVNHAVAGAVDTAVTGKGDALTAAYRGLALKDRKTFATVLGHAGVENPLIRHGVGFLLDVGLDPTTYLTGGITSVAAKAVTREAAAAGAAAALRAAEKGADKAAVKKAAGEASERVLREARDRVGGPEKRGIEIRIGSHGIHRQTLPKIKADRQGRVTVRGRRQLSVPIVPARASAEVGAGARATGRGVERLAIRTLGEERGTLVRRRGRDLRTGLSRLNATVRPAGLTAAQFARLQQARRSSVAEGEMASRQAELHANAADVLLDGEHEWNQIIYAIEDREHGIEGLKGQATPLGKKAKAWRWAGGRVANADRRDFVNSLANDPDRLYKIAKELTGSQRVIRDRMEALGVKVGDVRLRDDVHVPDVTATPAAASAARKGAEKAEREADQRLSRQRDLVNNLSGTTKRDMVIMRSRDKATREAAGRRAQADAIADRLTHSKPAETPEASARKYRMSEQVATLRRQADALDAKASDLDTRLGKQGRDRIKRHQAEADRYERMKVSSKTEDEAPDLKPLREKVRRARQNAARAKGPAAKARTEKALSDAQAQLDDAADWQPFRKGLKNQAREARKAEKQETRLHAEQTARRTELSDLNARRASEPGGYWPRIHTSVTEARRKNQSLRDREAFEAFETGQAPVRGGWGSSKATGSITEARQVNQRLRDLDENPSDDFQRAYASQVSRDVPMGHREYGRIGGHNIAVGRMTEELLSMTRKVPDSAADLNLTRDEAFYVRDGHRLREVTNRKEIQQHIDAEDKVAILPRAGVDWAENMQQLAGKGQINPWSRAQSSWKGLALKTPAYLVRNAMSDGFAAYGAQNPAKLAQNYGRMTKTIKGLRRQEQDLKWFDTALQTHGQGSKTVVNGIEMTNADLGREMLAAGAISQDRLHEVATGMTANGLARLFRQGTRRPRTPVWHQMAQFVEDAARVATYRGFRERGMLPEQAAAETAKIHFDYAMLTPFEKTVRANVVPFYTFTARNLPRQAQLMFEKPGKFAAYAKLQRDAYTAQGRDQDRSKQGVDRYELRQYGVPISYKGNLYTVSLGLPFTDLSDVAAFNPKLAFQKGFRDFGPFAIGQRGLEMMGPWKATMEAMVNYSFFYRDSIEKDYQKGVPVPAPPKPFNLFKAAMPKAMQDAVGMTEIVDQKTGETIPAWDRQFDYLMRQSLPGPLGILWRNSYDRTNVRGFSPPREALGAFGVRATLNDPLKREQSILAQENQAITEADRLAAAQGRTLGLNTLKGKGDFERALRRREVQKRQDQISRRNEPFSNAAILERRKRRREAAEENNQLALPTVSDTTSKPTEKRSQTQILNDMATRRQRRRYRRGIGPKPPGRPASEIPDRAKALPVP